MQLDIYLICIFPSIVLMILFVLINLSYYQLMYGKKIKAFLIRTISLNILAIIIGWFPAVFFWSVFSLKYLMPASCVFGAITCVGSRFIYSEIIPNELAEQILKIIKEKAAKDK